MYEIILSNKIQCPVCGKQAHLLQDRSDTNPKFYICYPCNFVGQVGVGPVTPMQDPRLLQNVEMVFVVNQECTTIKRIQDGTMSGKSMSILGFNELIQKASKVKE